MPHSSHLRAHWPDREESQRSAQHVRLASEGRSSRRSRARPLPGASVSLQGDRRPRDWPSGGRDRCRSAGGDHRDRLPFLFEDLGERSLKNIARPVRVYRVRTTLTHPVADPPGSPLSRNAEEGAERRRREAGEGSPALPLPDKPSIAVLPFANLSGDPEQEYFADGMVEEIITALSRIRWLFVIARNSSFTYKGQTVDVKQVGRELGVRYALKGSVRKASGRVRITTQLIDAAHLLSQRFDEALPNLLFAIQEDPTFPEPYRYLAVCYAHMGRLDEAREIVKRLRAITPVVVPRVDFLRNQEHREFYLSGLRLAVGEAGEPTPRD
jgi:TolB-like protein